MHCGHYNYMAVLVSFRDSFCTCAHPVCTRGQHLLQLCLSSCFPPRNCLYCLWDVFSLINYLSTIVFCSCPAMMHIRMLTDVITMRHSRTTVTPVQQRESRVGPRLEPTLDSRSWKPAFGVKSPSFCCTTTQGQVLLCLYLFHLHVINFNDVFRTTTM